MRCGTLAKLVEYLKDSPSILISAGESHSMCITVERGQCYTWGVGDYGKLGHGDARSQWTPKRIQGLAGIAVQWYLVECPSCNSLLQARLLDAAQAQQQINELGKRALAAYHANDHQKAYDLYTEAISKSPNPNSALHEQRAGALMAMQRFNDALAETDRAVQINPQSTSAHRARGAVLLAISGVTGVNRWEEAKAAFAKALEIKPTHENAREMLVKCTARATASTSSGGGKSVKTADAARAVDVKVTFDGLSVEPRLNVSTQPVRSSFQAGETVRFLATANYPAFIGRGEIIITGIDDAGRRERAAKVLGVKVEV